jgi:hypothetical protein
MRIENPAILERGLAEANARLIEFWLEATVCHFGRTGLFWFCAGKRLGEEDYFAGGAWV